MLTKVFVVQVKISKVGCSKKKGMHVIDTISA